VRSGTPDNNALDNSNTSLLLAMLRFAALINRPMRDGVATKAGISPNDLMIIMALGGEGELAGHDLVDLMGMQPMNVSRALAALSDRGWIVQVTDKANRRRKPHKLTEAGWAAYRAMGPEIERVAQFLFNTLDPAERAGMASVLDKLYRQVMRWDDQAIG
jgi:DNA-binding MarR family transcriptional regulator